MASLFSYVILSLLLLVPAFGEELLELSCIDAQQCKQFQQPDLNVTCIEGHCHCTKTNFGTEETVKCIPPNLKMSNFIGGHCPCSLPQAECNEKQKICYCMEGYVASTDKRRCIPEKVALDGNCETDKQCHATDNYAICDKSKKSCVCQSNFITNNGTCISIADTTLVCEKNSDCYELESNVVCLKDIQKCICKDGFVKASNKSECLPLVSYKENCTVDQQCQKLLGPGGFCNSNICECNDQHYVVHKKTEVNGTTESPIVMCARIIEIGEYCRNDQDCWQQSIDDDEQTMSCIYGECNCKWGYYSINGLECVKSQGAIGNLNYSWAAMIITFVIAIMH